MKNSSGRSELKLNILLKTRSYRYKNPWKSITCLKLQFSTAGEIQKQQDSNMYQQYQKCWFHSFQKELLDKEQSSQV